MHCKQKQHLVTSTKSPARGAVGLGNGRIHEVCASIKYTFTIMHLHMQQCAKQITFREVYWLSLAMGL